MKRKILWLVVSGLMVAALLVTSCAPAVTKEEEVTKEEIITFEKPFRLGETATTARLAVTVSEIFLVDNYEYYDKARKETAIKEPPPRMTFLFAQVKIKNVASEGVYTWYGGSGASPIFGGHSEGSVRATNYWGEDTLPMGGKALFPGDELEGKALVIVPKESTGHWIEFHFELEPSSWARWLAE